MMRSGRLDEDGRGEEERIFEEGEAPFHHALFAVEGDDGLIGPGRDVEQVGPDDEGRPAQRLTLQGDGVAGERRLDLPDRRGRSAPRLARTPAGWRRSTWEATCASRPRTRAAAAGRFWPAPPPRRADRQRSGCPDARAASPRSPGRAPLGAGAVARARSSPSWVRTTIQRSGPCAQVRLPRGSTSGASRRGCCCQPSVRRRRRSCTMACAAVEVSGTRLTQRTPAALSWVMFSAL